jgi:hypothetical protein
MVNKRGSRKRWETRRLALSGALLGGLLGIFEQFCHVFCPAPWGHNPGSNVVGHVLLEVGIGAVAGATLFAAISEIRNWLVQSR